ncbi:DUF3025 domain-containing protein [Moraxella marmotae]|uniref:DUF3025 domain-containing protein n=1 Tax=Moraxella marmotae TaxID=3344520 RepID=UPI0035F40186
MLPPTDLYSLICQICPTDSHLTPYADIHDDFIKTYQSGHLSDWLNHYFHIHHIKPVLHGTNQPLRFVAQDDLPHGTAYEQHIHQTGNIPTRDNLHDWFGACVWAKFPKSKAVLNAKHIQHYHDNDSGNGRNRVRDAITVFDENGAILVVSDDATGDTIAKALVDFDWQTCLVANRQHWHQPMADAGRANINADAKACVFIFGHALLEQMMNPYKSLCSHTVTVRVPSEFFGQSIDERLAMVDELLSQKLDQFLDKAVTPKSLNPLPILGVPYFWDNQDPQFYQDAFVFRSGRRATGSR